MRSTAIALMLISASVATVARAQDQVDAAGAQADAEARARAHFDAGRTLVEQRRYQEAYEEFRQGFVLSNRPIFLFNMAECAREAGQLEVARREYERYLQRDPDGSLAQTARERLAALPQPEPSAPEVSETPVEAPAVAGPDEAARQAVRTVPPSTVTAESAAPGGQGPQLYEEWWFWTIIGAVVVGAAVGLSVGLTTTSNGPACGAGCAIVDFR